MERVSFYDEIARNRRKSILLSLILIIIIAILATTISYMWAPEYVIIVLPISIIFMAIYTYSSYMYGDLRHRRHGDERLRDGSRPRAC